MTTHELTVRDFVKLRRHKMLLVWMNHIERSAAFDQRKKKSRRAAVAGVLFACGLVLAGPVSAATKVTDEEIAALLKMDVSAPTTLTDSSAPAASAETLTSKEGDSKMVEKPAAPKVTRPHRLKKLPTPKVDFPAVTKEEEKAKGKDVTLSGIVGGRNYYGIAVATAGAGRSSTEIWFNLVQGVKFDGAKSLMDFQEGDSVKVVYKELEKTKKRILKSVALLKKAPPEAPEERDDDLKANENG